MPTCFVIQPFDKGRFDKRYVEIFVPAIKAAGLDPYRVDKDFGAEIPIESIEDGIKSASVCLADITTDNPNVWYELGFAFAVGRPVVMVCAAVREGKQYPFDIQHRSVLSYASDSPGDFKALETGITKRLEAALEKGETIQQLADNGQVVAPVDGLSQPEMTVLALLAASIAVPKGCYSLYSLQQESEKAGLTKLGFTLSVRRLLTKKFISPTVDTDYNEQSYDALMMEDAGWEWIDANEDKFVLRKVAPSRTNDAIDDDDIPF